MHAFEAWNEPNIGAFLSPQYRGDSPVGPDAFRSLLNEFYDAVKAVSPASLVVTGGTGPYGEAPGGKRMRPVRFWRRVLCVPRRGPTRRCPERARFDVLSHHPINTVGGAGDPAANRDDVTVPDMHKLVSLLRMAERRGSVGGPRRHPVWATEIWWETRPDPSGVKPLQQARWIQEAFYRLWRQGVGVAVLLGIVDSPYGGRPGFADLQTGIYFADGAPKRAERAFTFPFVLAGSDRGSARIWTVAPSGGELLIQRRRRAGWQTAKRIRVQPLEVVHERVAAGAGEHWRGRIGGRTSLASRAGR